MAFCARGIYRLAEKYYLPLTSNAACIVNTVFDNAVAQAIKAYATHMTVELQKRREEHLSFVIHDLRTPLAAVLARNYNAGTFITR